MLLRQSFQFSLILILKRLRTVWHFLYSNKNQYRNERYLSTGNDIKTSTSVQLATNLFSFLVLNLDVNV